MQNDEIQPTSRHPGASHKSNRLALEKSPYLLQHAHNPVDWYPWGEEAFEKARRENKPVFLSIGYSSCHWCHVMEKESFEDEQVADLLNRFYVSIKVDREERPDIDKVYMDVTQRMTGGGGWPMTVVMTPDRKPFFAGTYFPKYGMPGRPGFMDILFSLQSAWTGQQDQIRAMTDQVSADLAIIHAPMTGTVDYAASLKQAYENLKSRHDASFGGFSGAPKFLVPHVNSFLVRYWKRSGARKAVDMADFTLTRMRLGGVFDQIGFGFHRYSTDELWLLPHFEKMLYDQALMAIACLDVYHETRRELHARTAREIFEYVFRDMTSSEGAFYSAEDADSEGEEGLFYTWTTNEIIELLGPEDGPFFIKNFNLLAEGNFRDQATGERTGRNIPFLNVTPDELATQENLPANFLETRMEACRLNLFAAREQRVHPLKDDKVLTDWNGLMIAALARGAQVLGDPALSSAAHKAESFVFSRMVRPDGRLLKRYREGEARFDGVLEDYAFMLWGLVELYMADFDPITLQRAVDLAGMMVEHFADDAAGGFFQTADDAETLLVRTREVYDGAMPSGNSAAAYALVLLARLTGNPSWENAAAGVVNSFGSLIARQPDVSTLLLQAMDFMAGPAREVVIVGKPGAEDTNAMLKMYRSKFRPRTVIVLKDSSSTALDRVAPFTEALGMVDEKATAYVCENFACKLPVTDPVKLDEILGP